MAAVLLQLSSSNRLILTQRYQKYFLHGRNSIPRIHLAWSSYKNGNGLPEIECPIPLEQQPINEYQSLSTSFPFSWCAGDLVEYCFRLLVTGASFALFIGLPVAWFGSVGSDSNSLKKILTPISSGIFVVVLAVLRMYLGWAYVGNRLLSATVEYEETGWYDGQTWVKPAQVLARDRLLGSFSVKPVLTRLKYSLVSLAATLCLCLILLFSTDESQKADVEERVIHGIYSEDSAGAFEPEAFCGEPSLLPPNH